MSKQRRPMAPVHMRAGADHVIALQRGNWYRGDVLEAERCSEVGELLGDRLEARLVEIDEIHLVHSERDLLDAEQRKDAGVTSRLGEHAASRIDQEHCEIAIRR